MYFRCKAAFTTREYGFEQEIPEDTVWYRRGDVIVRGGYECCNLIEVKDGAFTANYARIRLEKLRECFDQLPLSQCGMELPPELRPV